MKTKTKREIIIETSKAYTLKNRSFDFPGHNCAYKTGDKHCAVGRCLLAKSKLFSKQNNTDPVTLFKRGFDKQLKASYRGHTIIFWRELQILHDSSNFWSPTGISKEGKEYVENLLETWG